MIISGWLRHARRTLLATGAALALATGVLVGTATTSQAASQQACDIYAAGGTPCVAAHSTTRALYAAYNGPLYQVRRASDNATTNIGLLSAGGVANATAQDSFCAGTSCVITVIYDQSGRGNNLTPAPGGGEVATPDRPADATSAPVTIGGQKAYGVFISAGVGYRDDSTNGVATGDSPEGEYGVVDGTHYNNGCCFDYGNAETTNHDDGNGTMEAIYFGNASYWDTGAGNGPWIMADQENGLFSGSNVNSQNPGDPTINHRFTTAMLKGESNQWAIRGGDAQSGSLSTFFSGPRPTGYNPMHKEGAILLGIGGDNSNGAAGTFYEGVMTSGYPSDATENSVQANITAAGYADTSSGTGSIAPGSRISLQATTSCCTGDYIRHDDSDTKVVISPVDSSSSATVKADSTWIVRAGLANSTCVSFESANDPGQYLRHSNFQLYLNANDNTSLFAQDATFCPQTGQNGQGYSFQSVNYPDKYLRHFNYTVYTASDGGSNTWDSTTSWADDTSWLTAQPWG
ncbi:alpha-L-arabinofuranosidase B [Kitasatospora sp. NBC_01287]|uniref:alpha-L-arabinofuranosidase B n=1 Tax=Kitasatospora sp. NBC_01287 TaxID=2903573 RepID=UPI00224D7A76|nr:alpha-L-arabinofuranosidase B [Kitasatospora sp. NBC_01287]MCX4744717.1 alpha-L-arabinofuranosidase B [Kitasatospora sp. NBC_01287]